MEASEVLLTILTVLIAAAWAWMLRQQAEINARLDRIESELAKKADRDEMNARFAEINAEMNGRFAQVQDQFAQVQDQFALVHGQIGALRSDLTQIALAVGARPPRASEG